MNIQAGKTLVVPIDFIIKSQSAGPKEVQGEDRSFAAQKEESARFRPLLCVRTDPIQLRRRLALHRSLAAAVFHGAAPGRGLRLFRGLPDVLQCLQQLIISPGGELNVHCQVQHRRGAVIADVVVENDVVSKITVGGRIGVQGLSHLETQGNVGLLVAAPAYLCVRVVSDQRVPAKPEQLCRLMPCGNGLPAQLHLAAKALHGLDPDRRQEPILLLGVLTVGPDEDCPKNVSARGQQKQLGRLLCLREDVSLRSFRFDQQKARNAAPQGVRLSFLGQIKRRELPLRYKTRVIIGGEIPGDGHRQRLVCGVYHAETAENIYLVFPDGELREKGVLFRKVWRGCGFFRPAVALRRGLYAALRHDPEAKRQRRKRQHRQKPEPGASFSGFLFHALCLPFCLYNV